MLCAMEPLRWKATIIGRLNWTLQGERYKASLARYLDSVGYREAVNIEQYL